MLLKQAAHKHKRNSQCQVFTHENHAIFLYSDKFIDQKLEYIHSNVVRVGMVKEPEDSANNYALEPSIMKVNMISAGWKIIKIRAEAKVKQRSGTLR